jgi:hypothetical protein
MIKKEYIYVWFLISLMILLPTLIEAGNKKPSSGWGVYTGWSFATSKAFEKSNYRFMHYGEGINFQLGIYKEFLLSKSVSIQMDFNFQHLYFLEDGTWGYDPGESEYSVKSEPIISFSLHSLFYFIRDKKQRYYFLAGSGIGMGKISMDYMKSPHLHLIGGFGFKNRLNAKLWLNILVKIVFIPSDGSYHWGQFISYPSITAGFEF